MKNTSATLKTQKGAVSLNRYAGKWVAFLDINGKEKVVESSRTLKSLMSKVKKKGLEQRVSVFLVPKKGENLMV